MRPHFLIVNNQLEFENIPSSILKAARGGDKSIYVFIRKGVYFFDEGALSFNNIRLPDVSITIQGEKTILIPKGNDYQDGDSFKGEITPNRLFISDSFEVLDLFSEMQQANGIIEVVNEESGLCRIKTKNIDSTRCDNMYITIPQWYKSQTYKVSEVTKDYTCFVAHDLNKDKWDRYNVNYDYTINKDYPRYRLFNETKGKLSIHNNTIRINRNYKSVHSCDKCALLRIWNSCFKRFSIKGINVIGNYNNGSQNALMDFKNSKADFFEITDCLFRGIKSELLFVTNTDNILFKSNTVEYCYNFGITSFNGCTNTMVTDNVFHDNGLSLQQDYSVCCMGEDYYIANNTFYNFPYSAIRVGLHYLQDHSNKCNGVIENNELFYERDYFKHYKKHTLMDGGAIYVGTVNDGAIIRSNYIHDYIGMDGNRGIFCDDGAGNVELCNNVVTGIANYYAIDSRRVESMDANYNDANRNVVIKNNVVEGHYLFEGRDGSCISESNIIINPKDACKIEGVIVKDGDVVIKDVKRKKSGKLKFSRKQKQSIKGKCAFAEIKKWL